MKKHTIFFIIFILTIIFCVFATIYLSSKNANISNAPETKNEIKYFDDYTLKRINKKITIPTTFETLGTLGYNIEKTFNKVLKSGYATQVALEDENGFKLRCNIENNTDKEQFQKDVEVANVRQYANANKEYNDKNQLIFPFDLKVGQEISKEGLFKIIDGYYYFSFIPGLGGCTVILCDKGYNLENYEQGKYYSIWIKNNIIYELNLKTNNSTDSSISIIYTN